MNLLIIGGSGFVGAHLVEQAARAGHRVSYTYAHRRIASSAKAYRVRMEAPGELEACIADAQPDVLVYCAVPEPPAGAVIHHTVSVEGVQRALATLDGTPDRALFVYLSTNAVFSGCNGPYRENDTPDPEIRQDAYRAYALTRREGERVTLARANALVVRTATVNGRDVRGNLNARLAQPVAPLLEGKPLPRYCDRYLSPTLVDNLVEALLEVIRPDFDYRGILHIAGSRRVTDYEYSRCLARHLGVDERLVEKAYRKDTPSAALGPRDSSLDTAFTQSLLRTRLLDVEEQLARIFPREAKARTQSVKTTKPHSEANNVKPDT